MPAVDDRAGVLSWFVRRAGVARCTTIAGAAGLSVAALVPGRYAIAIAGLTLALGGILAGHVATGLRERSRAGLAVTLTSVVLVGLFAGLLVGTLRISSLLDGVLPERIGQTVRAEIVVTGPVSSNSGWQSANAVIRSISGSAGGADAAGAARTGVGEKILLEVAPSDGASSSGEAAPPAEGAATGESAFILTQGARLAVRGTLRAPEGPSASGYNQAKQLLHQGIRVVLQVDSSSVSYLGQRGGVSGWFDRLRASAKAHLSHGPNARVNEVLQGVVMGDTVGIDEGWMVAFRRSGTAHMLSVSGLHVASLAAIVIAIAGFARLSRRTGFVLAAAAALLMVPFVGSSPPIVRSAAMMMVVLGGRLVGRRRDQWQGLAFAALVVLVMNPFSVFDVGFQLSFSAFAGMLALVRPLERLLHRFPESVRADLAVSVAATLGTAPVSMLVFGRTSLISPVANLLVVPTLGLVTGLGMASVLLGFLWSGLSVALDTLASLPMMWTILVSTVCARAPVLGAGYIGVVLLAAAATAIALPAGLVLCGRSVAAPLGLRLPLFARTVAWLRIHRPRDRRRATALGFAVVALAAGLGAAAFPAGAAGLRSAEWLGGEKGWPAQTEVRVLDVGQGNAILIRTPDHHAALFDGGPAGCGLGGQLRKLGVKRLDLVVISHPHADHFAGLAEALDSVEIGTFVDRTQIVSPTGAPAADGSAATGVSTGDRGYSSGGAEARKYLELRARLAARGCRVLLASSGATLTFDGIGITLYAPARPLVLLEGGEPWGQGRAPPSGDELNGGSVVALLDIGGARVLLPGDAEADTLEQYRLPALDVLVVGHHGSRDAVSSPLLDELHPGLAVISVGKDNTFGHPDPSTIALLRAAGETVARTDQSGWVSLRVTDGAIAVSMERTRAP
jgi:competence protein ComEC